MLESLITSKTRIKLLLKFFLNYQNIGHLRGLEAEFGESSNSIRLELLKLESAGILSSTMKGNKKLYFANTNYPLFNEINSILKKFVGIDQIITQITSQIGDLDAAYLTGDIAIGKDSSILELILIGNILDPSYIQNLIEKAELYIKRTIIFNVFTSEEMIQIYSNKPVLLIWKADQSIT
jgi:hypothetical protein